MPNNTNNNNNNNKHNTASANNSLPQPPPSFACPHCPKVFGKPVKLERHLQVHHSHFTTLSIPSDILVQQQQQDGQREAIGEEELRRQAGHDHDDHDHHQAEGHRRHSNNDKENHKRKHVDTGGTSCRSVAASQLAVPAVPVPVEVGNTLVAALAQANLAFDAGHRLCLLCADDSNTKARTFASRKDLAAHIVAKHSTNLTTSTTAAVNNNSNVIGSCDPQHRLSHDSLSNKMRAASTLSPPQSMASSFGTVQSMTPSPPQAASTMVKTSTAAPLLNQNKKRARDISNDDNDQGKRAGHVEHDDGLDEIQPGPATKRVKLEVSVPSSGTKPPITPKKARPVVAPKTQALAEAARLNANNNNNASSSSLMKGSLKANSSSGSATQSPARISFSPTTKPGSSAGPAKNGNSKGDGVNNNGITTAGREQGNNATTTPANGNGGAGAANNNKNNHNKSQVLDFSAMVGIFTNSHKSYYRLVDP